MCISHRNSNVMAAQCRKKPFCSTFFCKKRGFYLQKEGFILNKKRVEMLCIRNKYEEIYYHFITKNTLCQCTGLLNLQSLWWFFIFLRGSGRRRNVCFWKKLSVVEKVKFGFTQINVTFFTKGQRNFLVDPTTAFRLALLLVRFARRPAKVRLRKRHTVAFAPLRMTRWAFVLIEWCR